MFDQVLNTSLRKRLRNVLNASQRRVNKNSLTWWYILKTSWRYLCKTSWRCLEDVFKTSWRRLEDVLKTFFKTSWRRFEDVLKMSWRRLENVLKTSWRRLENVLKTSWRRIAKTNILVLTKTSWRRLEDVFWRRKAKANIFVLIKTSSEDEDERRLEDVFKTSSSRRMFAGMSETTFGNWKPFKNVEKCFLFHLKSLFRSQKI